MATRRQVGMRVNPDVYDVLVGRAREEGIPVSAVTEALVVASLREEGVTVADPGGVPTPCVLCGEATLYYGSRMCAACHPKWAAQTPRAKLPVRWTP